MSGRVRERLARNRLPTAATTARALAAEPERGHAVVALRILASALAVLRSLRHPAGTSLFLLPPGSSRTRRRGVVFRLRSVNAEPPPHGRGTGG